ncbi:PREDICTED: neurotrypsin-like, partial [Amphimedon queenslandica]|uniref:SRCR domain-containing protein n=1 Tax=Amphimedon queenslandica TaxID=400682 RepID=A0AAN0JRS2_AMPQE
MREKHGSMSSVQSDLSTMCEVIIMYGVPDAINGAIVLSRSNISSTTYYYGTIRVYHNGWGNICDDYYYNSAEANVICHQLMGYTGASSYSRAGRVSYGTDYLFMKWDDVNCASSSYLSIAQCTYSTYIDSGCVNSNSYDATVYCYTTRIWNSNLYAGMACLQDGAYSNEGRVEVYCNGQWGTICSDGFDSNNANTICKQLGYDASFSFNNFSLHENSINSTVWSRSVPNLPTDVCFSVTGTCPVSLVSNCKNAVAVKCGEESTLTRQTVTASTCSQYYSEAAAGTIILSHNNVSSTTYYYGTIRVYYNGWGNICDDYNYNSAEANVICHQLGYTGASSFSRAGLTSYGTDYLSMKWDDVNCASSSYLSIAQCTYSTYIDYGCVNSNSYDATVYCYTTRIWNSNLYDGMVRLQDGDYTNEGRVEVYCNGQWGTICSDGFDSTDANTICKQLGYDSFSFFHLSFDSNDSLPFWASNMYSTANDLCFKEHNNCPNTSVTSCSYSNSISLKCSDTSTHNNLNIQQNTCANLP